MHPDPDDCVHIDPTTPVPNDGRLDDAVHPPAPFTPEPLDAGDTDGEEPTS